MHKIHLSVIGLLLAAVICPAQVTITEYPISSDASFIARGPDGNLWFTESDANLIGRITPAGVVTEFLAGSQPTGITAGPDGNLWFTEESGSAIGKMTTAGVVLAEYSVSYFPYGIVAGPDGNLWFTEFYTNQIGRITPAGVVTEFTIPTGNSRPRGITAGPDGNVWFIENGANKVGRINTGPRYSVCLLYDPTKAVRSGATMPIKLQLCDAVGHDLSSPTITVHAVSLTQTSTSISGAVEDSGNANPDSDFRFDSSLGSTGGYIFNLQTKGFSTGTYSLNFTVTGDSVVYSAPFQVK